MSCKAPTILEEVLHLAYSQHRAGIGYVIDGADQVSEIVFEVLRQAQPVPGNQLKPLQVVRQLFGDRAFLSSPIYGCPH